MPAFRNPILETQHDGIALNGARIAFSTERAGAYRVYEEPSDLMRHLDEVGVRTLER